MTKKTMFRGTKKKPFYFLKKYIQKLWGFSKILPKIICSKYFCFSVCHDLQQRKILLLTRNGTQRRIQERRHGITKTHTLKWHVFQMRIVDREASFQLCKTIEHNFHAPPLDPQWRHNSNTNACKGMRGIINVWVRLSTFYFYIFPSSKLQKTTKLSFLVFNTNRFDLVVFARNIIFILRLPHSLFCIVSF